MGELPNLLGCVVPADQLDHGIYRGYVRSEDKTRSDKTVTIIVNIMSDNAYDSKPKDGIDTHHGPSAYAVDGDTIYEVSVKIRKAGTDSSGKETDDVRSNFREAHPEHLTRDEQLKGFAEFMANGGKRNPSNPDDNNCTVSGFVGKDV